MKYHAAILTCLFATVSAMPLAATAASDKPAETKMEQSAGQKKVKPHSHVQEKTGVPQSNPQKAQVPSADQPDPAQDKSKHYHPRDAK